MSENVYFVGVDVDDKSFHFFAVHATTGEAVEGRCLPEAQALIHRLLKIHPEACKFRVCYEAGYLGLSLYRRLVKAGFGCEVIAPGLIPQQPSKRVKTDRIDAERLALYLKQGLLTPIYVPTAEQESHRDLCRTRKQLKDTVKGLKVQLLGLCRRWDIHGYKGNTWTQKHRRWLDKQISQCSQPAVQICLKTLLESIDTLEFRVETLDQQIKDLAELPAYRSKVAKLRCFRGIEVYTAMVLLTELGDLRRFPSPTNLVSYVGLGVREHSSGGAASRFGITKMGNKYVRTLLVEANQRSASSPFASRWLTQRRREAPHEAIEVADRCMKRLYKKAGRMRAQNKSMNKIKVACAREMLGFIWETMTA